jgi:asparagine synthase (glutamine-hydrolysing)
LASAPSADAARLAADLRARLEDTIIRHLISDVPLGLFLSGGVDSIALATLASRAVPARLQTLTMVFDEEDFSEAEPARQIAEQLGTDHREVRVTGADVMRELPTIVAAMDQPTHDGVNTYVVCQAARESGLTVVLSGLGGDEVFWGYRHYHWLARYQRPLKWWGRLPMALRQAIVSAPSAYGRLRGQERWLRLSGLSREVSDAALYAAIRRFFAPAQVADLLGLELHVPYLDHTLVEYAAALPRHRHARPWRQQAAPCPRCRRCRPAGSGSARKARFYVTL